MKNERKPYVVFVLTDDQGYGDLGCHGNELLKTPNLDRLHGVSVRLIKGTELYDIHAERGQENDISDAHPEVQRIGYRSSKESRNVCGWSGPADSTGLSGADSRKRQMQSGGDGGLRLGVYYVNVSKVE